MPASLSEDTAQAEQPLCVGLPSQAAPQLLQGHLPAAPTQRRANLSPLLGPSPRWEQLGQPWQWWKTTW